MTYTLNPLVSYATRRADIPHCWSIINAIVSGRGSELSGSHFFQTRYGSQQRGCVVAESLSLRHRTFWFAGCVFFLLQHLYPAAGCIYNV